MRAQPFEPSCGPEELGGILELEGRQLEVALTSVVVSDKIVWPALANEASVIQHLSPQHAAQIHKGHCQG